MSTTRTTCTVSPVKSPAEREADCLQALREGIVALGIQPGAAVSLFALASSYGKASACRMLADREARAAEALGVPCE
ncbi:hypothetical protein [Nevskia sp.]|uniref:hypothetical protein n=1 Tax=Nevskia sp. TaxID=1929292 RepID=UPI003F700ED3